MVWIISTDLDCDRNDALAVTPGGGKVGSLLSGALDKQLADLAGRSVTNRIIRLETSEFEAQLAGLRRGGTVGCVIVPATNLPVDLWDRLRAREPVRLQIRVDGDEVLEVAVATPLHDRLPASDPETPRRGYTMVGAHTHAEIAVSIMAQAVSVQPEPMDTPADTN